jgi:hypothetical protein
LKPGFQSGEERTPTAEEQKTKTEYRKPIRPEVLIDHDQDFWPFFSFSGKGKHMARTFLGGTRLAGLERMMMTPPRFGNERTRTTTPKNIDGASTTALSNNKAEKELNLNGKAKTRIHG